MERASEVVPGMILAGKYRIDRVLGSGGMGMVVAAHHLQLDERVAIKMLLPEMLQHREAVERFAREARAAVKIKSEYVARVSDVGTLESGAPYLVMEYLEGEDLSEWVDKRGALPVEQAVEFVLQACEALAEAHSLGIVHRDLKPANLFCIRRSDGLLSVKVLDFGISKMDAPGSDMGMTKTSTIMGSPSYMSPEQMASAKSATAQSDIWSIGAVLFELLTGRVPFQAETLTELVVQITTSEAPDVGDLRRDVPEGLRAIVRRCLERDRSKRYRSVAELADNLCAYGPAKRARASAERISRVLDAAGLSENALALPTSLERSGLKNSAPGQTIGSFAQTASKIRSVNRLGLYALAAVVAVGIGMAALLLRPHGEELQTEEPIVNAASAPVAEAPPPSEPAAPAPAPLETEPPETEPVQETKKPEESSEPAPSAPPPPVPQKKSATSAQATSKKAASPSSTSSVKTKSSGTTSAPATKTGDSSSPYGGRL